MVSLYTVEFCLYFNDIGKELIRMDQNNASSNTKQIITFVDVVKMFRGKLKFFIIAAIIAALIGSIVGGAVCLLSSSYGGTVNFYLTTKDGSQVLLPLLNSDSFAEKLLLEANGLPRKEECNAQDYDAALAALKAYNEARETKKELVKYSNVLKSEITVIENRYNDLLTQYETALKELEMYLSAQDEIAKGENYASSLAKYEAILDSARIALDTYQNETYLPAKAELVELEDEIVKARRSVTDTRDAAHEALEKLLVPWRAQEDVRAQIAQINRSVSYRYERIVDGAAENTVSASEANQNAAFLVVTVNVDDDEETASFIMQRLKERIPNFVEDNIERLTGVNEPKCTLISTFAETSRLGDSSLIESCIIYACVFAIIAIVVPGFFIVIKGILPPDVFEKTEKKKKNNKNPEQA